MVSRLRINYSFKIKAWKITFVFLKEVIHFFKSLTAFRKIVETGLDPRLKVFQILYDVLC